MFDIRKVAFAAALALLGSSATLAQEVRLVVPFAAGGPMDNTARILAPGLQDKLGQTVIVDARPGAAGVVGTKIVADAAPDGNTLILASIGSQVLAALLREGELSYDPIGDFTPISIVGTGPHVLVVNKNVAADDVAGLIELAKTSDLTFASSGIGGMPHLGGELINKVGGISMTHVPYGGVGPAMIDLLAGHVDVMVAALPTVIPQLAGGEIKALAFLDAEPTDLMPGVRTAAEQGFPELGVLNTYYILAPAGLPDDIKTRVEAAVLDARAEVNVGGALDASGILGPARGADAAAAQLASEFDQWGPLVRELGLSAE
jgi:tripartite-type tricarboxylate transporter receptor subunit TctC